MSFELPADGFFSIIDYTVDDHETAQALVDAFAAVQETWVRGAPGWLGARFLVSEDGHRVLNLVAWESEEAFRGFEATSDTAGRAAAVGGAVATLGGRAELRMTESPRYRLARAVTPAGSDPSDPHPAGAGA